MPNPNCCPNPYWCKPPPVNFPSICQVSQNCCSSTSDDNSAVDYIDGQTRDDFVTTSENFVNCRSDQAVTEEAKYGYQNPPPCGLNYNTDSCSACCWDTTLCYPVPEQCNPGDNVVTVDKPSQLPSIDSNTASLLAIYNYSYQRIISRSIKFVTSYYDWLYCQKGRLGDDVEDPNNPWSKPATEEARFLPPASLFTQLVQVIGWSNYTFDSVDVCNCFCQNFCQVIQLIANLDGNKVVRDFILDNAFTCQVNNETLGCGKLYNEGKLVDWGQSILSTLDVSVEILKSLDADNSPEAAEALLDKFCQCLLSAACGTQTGAPLVAQAAANCNNTPGINFDNVTDPDSADERRNNDLINLNKQFFAMFVDLIKFLLFDRDCEEFKDGDRGDCCACPPSVEDWMQQRCRVGTGNGKCVVCSGACAKYRRKDDYKSMLSVIFALKYSITLATLDRSGGADYATQVEQTYNALLSDYYNLYKDESGSTLTFYPDCAAPQFCCSTQNAAYKCVKIPGYGCQYAQGCELCPVPCLDTRLATFCCGNGQPYRPQCGTNSNTGPAFEIQPDGSVTQTDTAVAFCSNLQYNPCVVQPLPGPTIECNKDCCGPSCTDNANGQWAYGQFSGC